GYLQAQPQAFLVWTEEDGLPANNLVALGQDSVGYLYVRTDDGRVSRFDGLTFSPSLNPGGLTTSNRVTLPDGTSWLARPGRGVYHMSRQETPLAHYTPKNSNLPTNEVNAIFRDRQQRFWVATAKGLVRMVPAVLLYTGRREGLAQSSVSAVHAPATGEVFFGDPSGRIGSMDSNGFVRYLPRDDFAEEIFSLTGMGQDSTRLLFGASRSGITVYDDSLRIVRLTERSGLPEDFTYQVLTAVDTPAVWAIHPEAVSRITDRDSTLFVESFPLPLADVFLAEIHPQGGLLLSQGDGAIVHWRPDTILARYTTAVDEVTTDLTFRRQTQLWLLRPRSGLYYTDLRSDSLVFAPVNEAFGLARWGITRLLAPPNRPEIWLGAKDELIRLFLDRNGQPDWIKRYGRGEGYPGGTVQATTVGPRGDLWFGTTKGLIHYVKDNPNRFLPAPPTFLEGINLFYAPVTVDDYELQNGQPTFGPQNNHFNFRFRAVDHTYPQRVRYRYRLNGEWSPPSAETSVRYAGLAPGNYAFAVQATTDGGNTWGDAATYSFAITQPLLQQAWFLV
ncbi:MAG: two-component regulator propeller domain-containing protein, partial [Bacteroidota bacterium]